MPQYMHSAYTHLCKGYLLGKLETIREHNKAQTHSPAQRNKTPTRQLLCQRDGTGAPTGGKYASIPAGGRWSLKVSCPPCKWSSPLPLPICVGSISNADKDKPRSASSPSMSAIASRISGDFPGPKRKHGAHGHDRIASSGLLGHHVPFPQENRYLNSSHRHHHEQQPVSWSTHLGDALFHPRQHLEQLPQPLGRTGVVRRLPCPCPPLRRACLAFFRGERRSTDGTQGHDGVASSAYR